MNNSKTQQLNQLFYDWENKIPEYKGHFVKDGINNEDLYNATIPKILFITKEPNNPNQEADDFREWWKEEIRFTFSHRIAEWAYGIINKFPPYDQIKGAEEDKLDALHRISFMNVKKSGGKGISNQEEIRKHIEMNLKFIHEEIRIIQPEIIILGLSTYELRSKTFPELKDKWIESGYDIAIARYKYAKVIDFCHPSSRNGASASYSLLQNVINSPAFKRL